MKQEQPLRPECYTVAKAPPYLLAVILLMTIAGLMIPTILWLRPTADPFQVVTSVASMMVPTTAAILALMKAQETHASVNSRLDAWIAASTKEARREGADEEKLRANGEKLIP